MGIFDGMESMGFSEMEALELFPIETEKAKPKKAARVESPMDYLYAKETECPVCFHMFTAYIIRKSKLKTLHSETDMRMRYHTIDPNLYDILLCPACGYAALLNYFKHITDKQKELIRQTISPRYIHTDYAVPISPESAVALYKMALLCAAVTGVNAGQKAILCLKLAWVYRDMNDKANELLFIRNALTGLKEAYKTEGFPIGAMDEPTVKYMIGELLRRSGQPSEAMKWISAVVVEKNVSRRLKDRALTVKDLIREGSSA